MQGRNWCWTLQSPQEDLDLDALCSAASVRYLVCQLECGSNLHYQGYTEFNTVRTLAWLRGWLPGAHFEPRKGTRLQARDYCTKRDDTYVDGPWHWPSEAAFGDARPGRRSDLDAAVSDLRDGGSLRSIAFDHGAVFVKYFKGLERLRGLLDDVPSWREVAGFYIHGRSGCGKSSAIYQWFDPSEVYSLSSKAPLWFDGYCGQPALLIDEYSGLPEREALLRLLDGHPLDLPVKGSFVRAAWRWVFVLSNYDYTGGFDGALLRRFGAESRVVLGRGRELVGFGGEGDPRVYEFKGTRGSYLLDRERARILGREPGDVVCGWTRPLSDGLFGLGSGFGGDVRADVVQPAQAGSHGQRLAHGVGSAVGGWTSGRSLSSLNALGSFSVAKFDAKTGEFVKTS